MAQKDKLVNVPRDVDDEFYRYKMPVLRAKVEGKGNGIKTVIENCADIAKALDRNPDYVNKYFGFELGALTSTANDKYIVNGRHDADTLARVLDGFIEKFVLCGGCRNPETNVNIKGDKIFLVCRACGKSTQCDPMNKLVPYMTKKNEKKPAVVPARKVPAGKITSQKEDEEDDEEDWSLPTTRDAVEERRRQTLGHNDRLTGGDKAGEGEGEAAPASSDANLTIEEGQTPIEVLEKFWETNPTEEEAFTKITALATNKGWSEGQLLRAYVFPSLFAKDVKTDFYKKARYLNCFVKNNKKQQKVVLYCVEKLCNIVPATQATLSSFLNGLFVSEVLDEENLKLWYSHPVTDVTKGGFDKKASKAVREAAKPFIDWLQTAEEEESEDEF